MSVMVMDVEGTDGRERGEDQVSSNSLTILYLEQWLKGGFVGLREEIRAILVGLV